MTRTKIDLTKDKNKSYYYLRIPNVEVYKLFEKRLMEYLLVGMKSVSKHISSLAKKIDSLFLGNFLNEEEIMEEFKEEFKELMTLLIFPKSTKRFFTASEHFVSIWLGAVTEKLETQCFILLNRTLNRTMSKTEIEKIKKLGINVNHKKDDKSEANQIPDIFLCTKHLAILMELKYEGGSQKAIEQAKQRSKYLHHWNPEFKQILFVGFDMSIQDQQIVITKSTFLEKENDTLENRSTTNESKNELNKIEDEKEVQNKDN